MSVRFFQRVTQIFGILHKKIFRINGLNDFLLPLERKNAFVGLNLVLTEKMRALVSNSVFQRVSMMKNVTRNIVKSVEFIYSGGQHCVTRFIFHFSVTIAAREDQQVLFFTQWDPPQLRTAIPSKVDTATKTHKSEFTERNGKKLHILGSVAAITFERKVEQRCGVFHFVKNLFGGLTMLENYAFCLLSSTFTGMSNGDIRLSSSSTTLYFIETLFDFLNTYRYRKNEK
jgi:hypothetical protein